jgi:hypothetical protein
MQILIAGVLIAILAALAVAVRRRRIASPVWSIKVFRADSLVCEPPDDKELHTPTLQAGHVRDIPTEFVADPFLLLHGSTYYLFFEALNKATGLGDIGFATSKDGVTWHYQQIVLSEKFHLSYPQVFEWEGEFYMIPESVGAEKVLLYKAKAFPYQWEIVKGLLPGRYTDPSVFVHDGKWWMFAGSKGKNLHLFSADRLDGSWEEHPRSPLLHDNTRISRPGGRVIVDGGQIYRYTQDGEPQYGSATRVFRITAISATEYAEEELNLILSGTGKDGSWRKDGMHHIDQLKLNDNQWLIAVDGHRFTERNYVLWKLDRILAKRLAKPVFQRSTMHESQH